MTNPTAAQSLDLDKLEALERAATPGPWDIDTTRNDGEYGGGDDPGVGFDSYSIHDANGRVLLDTVNSDAASIEEDVGDEDMRAWDETARRNIEFIVTLRNALPALIAQARAAQPESATGTTGASRAEALRQEVCIMYQYLDDREWAEHIAVTPEGQCLETAITRLVSEIADLRAQLARQSQGAPRTPTREMLIAGMHHFHDKPEPATRAERVYRDMVDAAPPLSSEQQAEKGEK